MLSSKGSDSLESDTHCSDTVLTADTGENTWHVTRDVEFPVLVIMTFSKNFIKKCHANFGRDWINNGAGRFEKHKHEY